MAETRQTLENYIKLIQDKEKDVYGLVDDVNRDFRNIELASVGMGALGGITMFECITNRDKVIDAIKKMIHGNPENQDPGLEQFISGMRLPVTMIDIADKWKSISNGVTTAKDSYRQTELSASWKGHGQDNYQAMRLRQQEPAFTAMISFSNSVASELETLAKGVVDFYGKLETEIVSLIKAVKNFANNMFSLKLVQAAVDIVIDLCSSIVNILVATVSVLTTSEISQNHLVQAVKAQDGFTADNKWPSPETSKFADFSILDGDNNTTQWSII